MGNSSSKNQVKTIKFPINREDYWNVRSIIVNNKKIPPKAFTCSRFTSIQFTENSKIKSIPKLAFSIPSLETLTIPSSVSNFGEGWIDMASKLKEIRIINNGVNNIKYIDDNFIVGKSNPKNDEYDILCFVKRNIKEAIIPSNIKRIASCAFEHCQSLENIIFKEDSQLEIIEYKAFAHTRCKSICIPPHLKTIGRSAFEFSYIEHIQFSENSELQEIQSKSFFCSQIKQISIPPSVTKIDEEAFKNCHWLHELIIPQNSKLKSIGALSFCENSFDQIFIPSNVTSIERCLFHVCKNLKKVEISNNSELKVIKVNAFYKTGIESISLPSSIIEFKDGWSFQIRYLKDIRIFPNNNVFNIKYLNNSFIVKKSNLENNYFDVLLFARRNINEVIIPSYIKSISSYAFENCYNLWYVDIPANSKLKTIGSCAFSFSALKSFSFHDHITEKGENAFCDCISLQIVEFKSYLIFNSNVYMFCSDTIFMVQLTNH